MLTPLYLLFGLIVATCVIAYWADNLGKKLGKKRISLFGLRPRQTATLISMVSSVGIMILTLAVLLGFNRSLRRALLRYDDISRQNQELTQQANLLTKEASLRQVEVNELRTESRRLIKTNAVGEQRLGELKKDLVTAQSKLATAQQGEASAKQREAQALQQASLAQQQAGAARREVTKAKSQLEQVNEQMLLVNQQLQQSKRNLTFVRANLTRTKSQLAGTKSQLTQTRATLHRTTAIAWRSSAKQMRDLGTITQKTEILTARVKSQEAEVADLEEQRKNLEGRVRYLQTAAEKLNVVAGQLAPLANGRIIVSVGQALAARLVPAQADATQARTLLRAILEDATKVVNKPPIEAREVHLAPLGIEAGNQQVQLAEDEIINRLADYLTTFTVPVSVRLVAAYNYVEGESDILGRMIAVPVRSPVVSRGDLLAVATIDGSQTDARVFNQLLALVNEGERTARGKEIMPPLTIENPNFYATGTNERIFDALHRIQQVKGLAKVRLVAAEDLSTVEPVHVRFEVGKVG